MEWDVIVVGSGAAGLTAAVRAAADGLSVIVLEKSAYFGGTTAISGGGIWIPGSPQAQAEGLSDGPDTARGYVMEALGDKAAPDLIDAYLHNGPEMVAWLSSHTDVEFLMSLPSSDWYPEASGAVNYGRVLSPKEFDGKALGDHFGALKPGREEFNAPGGFMVDMFDLPYLANMRSLKSIKHFGRLAVRFVADKARGYPRGTRLTMGNALVGRLLLSAIKAGVTLEKGTGVDALIVEDDRVVGVRAKGAAYRARRGVVLASGGFSANETLRRQYMPYPEHHVSILPYENTGDGMKMGLAAGAAIGRDNFANGVWSVVSTMTRPDGYVARYAHLIDMAKPGCIAVNADGERFGDEASVHFVEAMHTSGAVPAHIIGDATFVKKYGLGMVYPGGAGLKKLIRAGYVTAAPTLRELAQKIGVNPDGLERTAARMNEYAARGVDPDFGKGDLEIDREMGDPKHGPNPCLGVVKTGPFYAVQIFPGDGSTTVGLEIDAQCRVLDKAGQPINGLYAAGLDANSIWRGKSPAHGCNVGPAMVLGYIAGKTLKALSVSSPR